MSNSVIDKTNSLSYPLNDTRSWTGGVLPDGTDIGRWNYTTSLQYPVVGGALTVGALQFTSLMTGGQIFGTSGSFILNGLGTNVGTLLTGVGLSVEGACTVTFAVNISTSAAQTWNVANSAGLLKVGYSSATVTSSTLITKTGVGTLEISNAQSGITGGISVTDGLLSLPSSQPIGEGSGTITINSAGTSTTSGLKFPSTGIFLMSNPISIGGYSSFLTTGATSTLTLLGTVSIATSNPTLDIKASTVTFSGVVSGSGMGFTKAGAGKLILTNVWNSISGTLTHNSGILTIHPNNVWNETNVSLNSTSNSEYFELPSLSDQLVRIVFTGSGQLRISNTLGTGANFVQGALSNVTDSGTNYSVTLSSASMSSYEVIPSLTIVSGGGAFSFRPTSTNIAYVSTAVKIFTTTSSNVYRLSKYGTTFDTQYFPVVYTGGVTYSPITSLSNTFSVEFCEYSGNINQTNGTLNLQASLGYSELRPWYLSSILSGTSNHSGTNLINNTSICLVKSSGALGASGGSVTVTGTTTPTGNAELRIEGGISINKVNTVITLGGRGFDTNGCLRSISGNNTITAAGFSLNMSQTTSIGVDSGTLTLIAAGGMYPISTSSTDFYKFGAGELILPVTSTLTKSWHIYGTITATSLPDYGTSGSMGLPEATAQIYLRDGSTLKYVGSGNSTNRKFVTYGNHSFDSSGSGPMVFTGGTYGSVTPPALLTVTFTGSYGDSTNINRFSYSLTDNAGNQYAFLKSGSGAWKLDGTTLFIRGGVTVTSGILDLGGIDRISSFSDIFVSGGTLQNGTALITPKSSLTLNGTGVLKANLQGNSKTLSVTGGTPEMVPQSGANNINGTASISSGELRLTTETDVSATGAGQVLGTMDVTISAGAAVRCSTGTNQKGRMRWGGSLTFNGTSGNPAKLYLGG